MSKNGYSDIKKYARRIDKLNFDYEFSICTLITKPLEYQEMLQSFHNKGFTHPQCEFLYIDNTHSCTFDAYKGLNCFLQSAKGKYIILCHQDILLHDNDKNDLLDCISEIEKQDPNWAVLGNGGGINFKWLAMHITQGCGNFLKEDLLPIQTKTVDENFIVVKNEANLALSNDLNGFHMYGADLCLISDILGFTSYIIAFNIIHKSNGNVNEEFHRIKKNFIKKYARAFRSRFMATTITRYFISGNLIKLTLYNLPPIKFLVRQYYKLFKPKKRYYLFEKKMIPVKSNTIIYILCAPNFATGGPEALHQLGHYLIKLGITAKMFYYPARKSPVHPFYIKYQVPYVFNIDNSTDNYLILPETSACLLYEKKFNKTKKIIWWLSVTNYYKILTSLIEKTKNPYTYWFKKLYNPIKFATLDNIKKSGALNLAHSYFSIKHLKENGINPAGQISDYMNASFFKAVEQNVDKKNLIIYNPVKNGAFLNKIISQTPGLKWVPIQGLDPDNVAGIMNSAKLYVDFGYHPGKERMPREACIMGCCLIIGKDGSAKFKQDMPIPEQFRFEKQDDQIPQIIKTIRLCLEDYPHQSKLFSDYRSKLYDEEKVFEKDIQKTFVKI